MAWKTSSEICHPEIFETWNINCWQKFDNVQGRFSDLHNRFGGYIPFYNYVSVNFLFEDIHGVGQRIRRIIYQALKAYIIILLANIVFPYSFIQSTTATSAGRPSALSSQFKLWQSCLMEQSSQQLEGQRSRVKAVTQI